MADPATATPADAQEDQFGREVPPFERPPTATAAPLAAGQPTISRAGLRLQSLFFQSTQHGRQRGFSHRRRHVVPGIYPVQRRFGGDHGVPTLSHMNSRDCDGHSGGRRARTLGSRVPTLGTVRRVAADAHRRKQQAHGSIGPWLPAPVPPAGPLRPRHAGAVPQAWVATLTVPGNCCPARLPETFCAATAGTRPMARRLDAVENGRSA